MSFRRTLALAPAALALSVALAACGSQLDPQTVAAANGTTGFGGPASAGQAGADDSLSGSSGGSGGAAGDAGGGGGAAGGSSGSASGGSSSTSGSGTSGSSGDGGGTDPANDPIFKNPKINCNGFKNTTGITGDKIVIANVSDLSGPVPGIFQSAADAVKAFAMYFNANSDICGRKLEVLSLDSRADAGADQQGYQKACEQAFAAVGSMSAFDSGGAATAQGCGLPDIRAAAVTPERTKCTTCFGTQSTNASYFENAVPDFILQHYKDASQKGAFLYLNAGAAAVNGQAQIRAMTKRGIHFVYTHGIDVDEFNYGPYVQQMKDKGVKYVQWLGSYQHGVRLAQEMQKDGFKPDLFMFDPVAYDSGFVQSGGSAVEGVTSFMNFVPFEEASSNPEMQLYLKYLQQVNPDAKPSFFGVFAWSAARLFVTEALALGGNLSRASLVDKVRGVDNWTANGLHAPQHVGPEKLADCWRFLKLTNGKWVPSYGTKYSCTGATSTS